jgi:hypothetical protein
VSPMAFQQGEMSDSFSGGDPASGFQHRLQSCPDGRTRKAGTKCLHYRGSGLSSESQLYAAATRASISLISALPLSPFVSIATP